MTYQDTMEKWHRQQYSNDAQRRWQEQEQAEDRAREIVAEQKREHKLLDTRPTSEEDGFVFLLL